MAAGAPMVRSEAVREVLCDAVPVPPGFRRFRLEEGSFAAWVRRLPVQAEGAEVMTWDGRKAPQKFYRVWRVSALPLKFRQDLEQCADWAFRLWHEYQSEAGAGDDAWLLDYNGRHVRYGDWKKARRGASPDAFFRWAASNANSHSQKQGLRRISGEAGLLPGDILVQNETGGVGHTSIVLDAAEDSQGIRVFLMGFGFMPAQNLHVERADPGRGPGGWFTLDGYQQFLAEHLPFGPPVLRGFTAREQPRSSR